MSNPGFYAVVPAGGAGTRLWPLSRAGHPKFLHDLTGTGSTLLQSTWQRLAPLAEAVLVVTGTAHAAAVARQLPDLAEADLLVEPSPRDSTAAIGLAAALVARRDPDAVIGSFAADHVIGDQQVFAAAVAEAVAVARTGRLVTVGITPTFAATGFGYVRADGALDVPAAPSALQVTEFVEKPDAPTAAAYLAGGQHLWNAGMFVVRAGTLLDLLGEHQPALAAGLATIADAWDGPAREQVLGEVWSTLPKIAIDYAVAEPAAAAGRVAVVPGRFGWDDIGDFDALATLLPADGSGVQGLGDAHRVVCTDARALVVPASGRLVAVLGLDDVVVVDTPDAVLVTSRARAQEVKAVVDALRAAGRTDLL
ncbi:MAG: mannose-1-phosphate guanylyltransferase [Actinomycetota bacterium]